MKSHVLKSFNEGSRAWEWEEGRGISHVAVFHGLVKHDWVELRVGTRMCRVCRLVEDIGDEFM